MQTIAHSGIALCKPVHVMHLGIAPRGAPRQQKSRSPKAPAVQLVVRPDRRQKTEDENRGATAGFAAVRYGLPRGRREPVTRSVLRTASRPYCQVPHLRQNARHLHPVQL
jgi:hypothetical protein